MDVQLKKSPYLNPGLSQMSKNQPQPLKQSILQFYIVKVDQLSTFPLLKPVFGALKWFGTIDRLVGCHVT